jgi:hypothetical protein
MVEGQIPVSRMVSVSCCNYDKHIWEIHTDMIINYLTDTKDSEHEWSVVGIKKTDIFFAQLIPVHEWQWKGPFYHAHHGSFVSKHQTYGIKSTKMCLNLHFFQIIVKFSFVGQQQFEIIYLWKIYSCHCRLYSREKAFVIICRNTRLSDIR